mmetsp:Transcript_12486/g.29781  ORF Transcript_12486/g.29781 Transcript_12486/m.29781 type:complete len:142 (+) Transcript_12486:129-554(+)
MSPPTTETPPKNLLGKLCWSFAVRSDYATPEDFGAAVLQYQMDIVKNSNGWEPDGIILPFCRVGIHWEGLDREQTDMIDKYDIVESSSSKGFTALDLLYKVHQIMVEDCRRMDHCFFEGFDYVKGPDTNTGVVEYSVSQGS